MRVESDVEKQLASTHSISQKGMDQSSILECLQKKVSELLKYKEKSIAIETQLKIAQETLNLQAAEFAFEREEYENEIESLKKRSKMVPPEEAARRFDVEVRLKQAESKSEQFQSKYGKWKEKAKTLRQETRQLQLEIKKLSKANEAAKEELTELHSLVEMRQSEANEERELAAKLTEESSDLAKKLKKATERIQHLEEENATLKTELEQKDKTDADSKEKINVLKSELKQKKSEQKDASEKLQTLTRELTNEKAVLEAQLRKQKAELKAQELQIQSLLEEQKGVETSAAASITKMTEIEEENQKLRLKVKSLTKLNRKMEETENKLKRAQDIVLHCEEEMTNICDTLGIDPCQLDGSWAEICDRCTELQQIKDSVTQVKANNAKLQKRLTAILTEKRQETESQKHKPEETDDCLGDALKSVRVLKDSNDKKDETIKKLKYHLMFSTHLVEQYFDVANKVSALHRSMFDRPEQSLRSVILCIVFARRMDLYRHTETTDNPLALQIFSGRLEYAPDAQITEIRQKVAGLTQDLCVSKQALAEFTRNKQSSSDERDSLVIQLRTKSDQAELATRKLKYLKQRMLELQEELATLVPPNVHDDVCEELQKVEARNSHLSSVISKYERELEVRCNTEQELRDKLERMALQAEQEAARATEIQSNMGETEERIETLETLIREKTREILSLERLVHRQTEKMSVENMSINTMATENQALLRKSASEGQTADLKITTNVNPAFL